MFIVDSLQSMLERALPDGSAARFCLLSWRVLGPGSGQWIHVEERLPASAAPSFSL